MALTHPPPPLHPHPHSSSPSTAPYNKAPRAYGGCGAELPPSHAPFAPFIPSPSSAFTPASSSYASPPPPPPPPVSYPSSPSSSSSPPVLVPPQPSVYNTPINLYSNENACEVAMGQRRGLLESQGGALPLQLNGWVAFSPANQTKESTLYVLYLRLSPPWFKCLMYIFFISFHFLLCFFFSIRKPICDIANSIWKVFVIFRSKEATENRTYYFSVNCWSVYLVSF